MTFDLVVDHDVCRFCGKHGTVQINVHKCVKICTSCYTEVPAQYFQESTGVLATVTNPGRYTRRNQMLETMERVLCKRPFEMPDNMLESMREFIAKYRIKPDLPTFKSTVLRPLGYTAKNNNYTEHVVHIFCVVTNTPPPQASIEDTRLVMADFDALEGVYEQAKQDLNIVRINWPSYEKTWLRIAIRRKFEYIIKWLKRLQVQTDAKQDVIFDRMFDLLHWEY